MAQVLSARAAMRLWAVDRIVLAYLAATSVLTAAYWNEIPEAAEMLSLNVAFAALIVLALRQNGKASWVFRHWYPLPVVVSCYRQMARLIPAVRGTATDDRWLADLDHAIWRANPSMWLERIQTPALTDVLQILYALFVPAVLLVPWLLWRKRRFKDFQYCAFVIAAGFLISYVGYILVPARGPRFLFDRIEPPLDGGALVRMLRAGLDWLESAHYDCFPSGHVELTMIAAWLSRLWSRRLFGVYAAYTLSIIFATVYLRYHYSVDVLAGALVAGALIAAGPAMYRNLSGEESSVH